MFIICCIIVLAQMEKGVLCLSEVLKKTSQHHSKSWYMLKARALQTASAYLSLDTGTLHTHLRQTIIQHGTKHSTTLSGFILLLFKLPFKSVQCYTGLKTPDTAQYEGLKLLCSLVMMLLGNGFYGAPGPNTDTRFVDQGNKSFHTI